MKIAPATITAAAIPLAVSIARLRRTLSAAAVVNADHRVMVPRPIIASLRPRSAMSFSMSVTSIGTNCDRFS